MKHSRMLAGAVALAAVVSMALATVAWAQPIREEEVFQETEIIDDFCDVAGLTVQLDSTVDLRSMQNTHGPDGLVYFQDHLRVSAVYTNLANGNTVAEALTSLFKDLRVTDNDDGTLTTLVLGTGNAVVYGPDGKASPGTPARSGSRSWLTTAAHRLIHPTTRSSTSASSRNRPGAPTTSARPSYRYSSADSRWVLPYSVRRSANGASDP